MDSVKFMPALRVPLSLKVVDSAELEKALAVTQKSAALRTADLIQQRSKEMREGALK